MLIGVGRDRSLYTREGTASWSPIAASGDVIAVTSLPDGRLLGVGTANDLWTRATLTSTWQNVPSSAAVTSVALLDARLLGVGMDGQLYLRDALTLPWRVVPGSGTVRAVTVMPSGRIVAVGGDGGLLYRDRLGDPWAGVPGSAGVRSVAALPDGRILAAAADGGVRVRASLTSPWAPVPCPFPALAVGALADGSVLAVDSGRALRLATGVPSAWSPVAGSGSVLSATCLPDGRIVGVGTDNQLYVRATLGGAWELVPGSGTVQSVATLADGRLLGVGGDDKLYVRATLTSPWQGVAGSGDVTSAAQLPDGRIVGVGLDARLWVRPGVTGAWEQLPGDASWSYVAAQPDGTLLLVDTHQQLWLKPTLLGPAIAVAPADVPLAGVAPIPDPARAPAAREWLLGFTASDPNADDGDGRPWGDGTAMAARARTGELPWDNGSLVTPLVGGHTTMSAIREAFEAAIADAGAQAARGVLAGERGHVYVADWLMNGVRDLSEANPWGGGPWNPSTVAPRDQTALGLVLRMMAAGICVRLLLWQPTTSQSLTMGALSHEHWSLAAAIQDFSASLDKSLRPTRPLGVVALDLRTGAPLAAALHQKMVAIRVGSVDVAFCGGVDLAFTRRDFGRRPSQIAGIGDWQSGDTTPIAAQGWPKQQPPPGGGYPRFPYDGDSERFPEDLPPEVYGKYYRHWHDHHLKLEGPIVATLEQQFAERWMIDTAGRVYLFNRSSAIGRDNQVQLTDTRAIAGSSVAQLPRVQPCAPIGGAAVQMWRTIPLRSAADRQRPPFRRGELTVMAGVAKAVARARQLITIWDQYFWSVPLALLLAARLRAVPDLRLLIVLPPYGTTDPANELRFRARAMKALWGALDTGARARVAACDMWVGGQTGSGIYVHAKAQTYDDALLVCGSANMNRRSLECDAELDCAVLHPPTVRAHMANLYLAATGSAWTDYGDGWLARFWRGIVANGGKALIRDPFFAQDPGSPHTPNNVPMPYNGWKPESLFEPTSIGPAVESNVCQFPGCPGDPKVAGRLDEVTYLVERCHQGGSWPWRAPATWTGERGALAEKAAAPEPAEVEALAAQLPRLTL